MLYKKMSLKVLLIMCSVFMVLTSTAYCQEEVNALYWQVEQLPESYSSTDAIRRVDRTVVLNTYECLTRIDTNGKVVMAAAENVIISKDKKQYTFLIRDHKWNYDFGEIKVTAYDFERSWNILSYDGMDVDEEFRHLVVSPYQEIIEELGIESFKAINDNKFQVNLTEPCDKFLKAIASPEFAPSGQISVDGRNVHLNNGPYDIHGKSYTTDGRLCLTLKKNKQYWNSEEIYYDEIVLVEKGPAEKKERFTNDGYLTFDPNNYTDQELFDLNVLHINDCIDGAVEGMRIVEGTIDTSDTSNTISSFLKEEADSLESVRKYQFQIKENMTNPVINKEGLYDFTVLSERKLNK